MENNLDFGLSDLDSQTTDLSTIEPSPEDRKEASRYDNINNMQDKRKQVLWDIKQGILNANDYPVIFKKFIQIINKLPDGRFVYVQPNSNYERSLRTKLITFIQTGKIGDALVSSSMGEIKKIIKDTSEEVLRHIPLNNDHPMRKLKSLYKNGTIQEIIDFYLKKNNYDMFDSSWVHNTLNPEIMKQIFNFRKIDKSELKGNLKESIERIKLNLKQIYNS